MAKNFIRTILRVIFPLSIMMLAAPAIAQVVETDVKFFDVNRWEILVQPTLNPTHANHGAFEGGQTGTQADAHSELRIPEDVQRGGGGFNIPTGAPPSPLTILGKTATPWTQKLFRFEEYGTEPLDKPVDESAESAYNLDPANQKTLPAPNSNRSGPNWASLDTFLQGPIYPYPTEASNTGPKNPWFDYINPFLGYSLTHSPAEGRPPGDLWSHQRWDEMYPAKYFETATAGARTNRGARDTRQMHGYAVGEFGPGGLYHNTVGNGDPAFKGTTAGIAVKYHPNLPVQQQNSLWTFDGTFPPKLLNVRYGEGVLMRHYNTLPLDPAANNGFGLHTISTHEHNGHNPSESDGYTNAFYFPGQYYDYRWPIQLAGYDEMNTEATDSMAAFPCEVGETLVVNKKFGGTSTEVCGASGRINIRGDYRETMSTHWFHDHMLDFTAQNVYKGNAAMMNYYSAIDRGNEAINDGVNLRLPSGTAKSWGNRDYDVNLLVAAKAWDNEGQLFFNVFNTDGFLGDRMLVNWLFKPTMDVRARKYRFRILNASVSRYLKVAIVDDLDQPVPFHMIANDGNIMEHAVYFPDGILPTQSIAERYDIIIDFSKHLGRKIFMVNVMEHKNGRGPENDAVPLADVLDGTYQARIVDNEWVDGDPVIGKFMRFDVDTTMACFPGSGTLCEDNSMNPAEYEVGGKQMIPLRPFTQAELDNATHRTFDFGRSSGTDELPWTIKTDGGAGYNMDPRRLSAAPDIGDVEIWHMSTGGGWSHPIHVHFEEGQILSRDGMRPPLWETLSRKDVYRIGPETQSSRDLTMAIRFREFGGTYMEHCHNTQHEDTAMLLRWDIETGNPTLLPTPMPTWSGVTYADSFALATYKTGDLAAKADGVVIPNQDPNAGDVNGDGVIDRIFDDEELRAMGAPALTPADLPDMTHILTDYIKDENMAVALGKAFFWDQTVGSDGQACASCHFNAGADSRSKNQLSAGFDGIMNKPENYQLVEADFPFSKVNDDVAGSQGAIEMELNTDLSGYSDRDILIAQVLGEDLCTIDASLHFRQVTGRNSPSVINAVFNHRNFWDGRANNMFNGRDPFGPRTNQGPGEGIWTYDDVNGAVKSPVLIKNASLASQATGPVNDTTETACGGRTFLLLGRKMIDRKALSTQIVASTDSVLGPYKPGRGKGLTLTYEQMIRAAFQDKYWEASVAVETIAGEGFTQMEANFSLFWGLAIQMYEATLISDQTRYDMFANAPLNPGTAAEEDAVALANAVLTEQEKLGMELFFRGDRGNCSACHTGSVFTAATVAARALAPDGGFEPQPGIIEPPEQIERMRMADGNPSIYDGGFYNIGVTLTEWDKCVGNDDAVPGPYPLSWSRQAVTGNIIDPEAGEPAAPGNAVDAEDFAVQGGPVEIGERDGADGACKTPSLRNVELTAPYFHNGSHSTLEQTITSYMLKFKHLFADENEENVSPEILAVNIGGLSTDGTAFRGGEPQALVAFMKTLTDERVRLHKAPFDHPSLAVPNGSTGDDLNADNIADDILLNIPAVGAGGYAEPLADFLETPPPPTTTRTRSTTTTTTTRTR
jgi:cytochrome c peroxidase/FtsP/CotA-like multicopper oxidase with cupredoxin domain